MLGQNQSNLNSVIGSGQLRHRPRLLDRRGRRRQPGGAVHREQGARRHRPVEPGRRRLRHRLRGPRDGPPVRRRPYVQRHHAQMRRRQPLRLLGLRAGQRLDDHGLRRHLRRRGPPAAQRRHLPHPQLRPDRGLLDRGDRQLLRGQHRDRQHRSHSSMPAPPSRFRGRRRSPSPARPATRMATP